MDTITLLGGGAFGTAIATLLAESGYNVLLWCNEQSVVDSINKKHENDLFLPGVNLNEKIKATIQLDEACAFSSIIFEAIPILYLRGVLEKAKPYVTDDHLWVALSKGIEQKTLLFSTGILDDVFGKSGLRVVVSGPSFAKDLVFKMPTALTVASNNQIAAQKIANILTSSYCKPYVSSDPVGVQVCGALKNVITIAVGLIRGAGYTDNTAAFLVTRSLKEITKLVEFKGGNKESVYGFAGVGDVVLTAMGASSRNLKVGMLIGKGRLLTHIREKLKVIPEGINTLQSLWQFMQQTGLQLPLCDAVYQVVFKNKPVDYLIRILMSGE